LPTADVVAACLDKEADPVLTAVGLGAMLILLRTELDGL
jgi:hypothetical protein